MSRYFVTGVAGFVGFHLAKRLLAAGHEVRGFDGMTDYYDPALKEARVRQLEDERNFSWVRGMLEDAEALAGAATDFRPDVIIHLAAQAGVRYSLEAPRAYIDANLVGTFNVLELAREFRPDHLLLASTSSVYGGNEKLPFGETDASHLPMSLYAATKKATEAMSHSYAHLFNIPTTCFRFFTVYGPWGRPDMALFKFVNLILRGEPIDVYGEGRMSRDFTYVDDLIVAIDSLALCVPRVGQPVTGDGVSDSLSPVAPWRVVNIAGGRPVELMDFIEAIERHVGRTAEKRMLPMQPGDVVATRSDPALLKALTGFEPGVDVNDGVGRFVEWYRSFYQR